jgi:hypothetical protein
MSSDPSLHLPSPVAPPDAAEVDPQSAEPPEVMHRTRAVDFLGRRTPIVYQNDNGPCPLLAICELPPPSFDSETSRVRRASARARWSPAMFMAPARVCVQVTCCC